MYFVAMNYMSWEDSCLWTRHVLGQGDASFLVELFIMNRRRKSLS